MKKKLLTVAVTALLTGGLAFSAIAGMIQAKGSDTLVHVASAWAEAFMKQNPEIQIAVTGGGSGTGISSLLNGSCDIANASRKMSKSELNTARSKGWEAIEHIVGLDGIAVIVNPANPVKELTMDQIKKIFTGEVSNWKQVGGSDAKIIVTSRDSSSGTFQFFQEHVLNKKDYSVKARRMPSNSSIINSVQEDANTIGYVGLGYLSEAKGKVYALSVKKDQASPAVKPEVETVKNNTYPISRGLQMYTKGQPQGDVAKFMTFINSSEGQKIVEEQGFVAKP